MLVTALCYQDHLRHTISRGSSNLQINKDTRFAPKQYNEKGR